jgi:16S rRNA (guanine527-N7)-methyltransferase
MNSDEVLGQRDDVVAFFGDSYGMVKGFHDLLLDQGELRGLIGPREVDRLWERHILNSAALTPFLPETGTVVDVGSGAGLPGVVIAMMRPDLEVILVEPMERRTSWLTEVKETFSLDKVVVNRGRAEEYHGAFEADVVTARAVANLEKLSRMTLPLLKKGGELVLLKGRNVATEIEPARKVLRKYQCTDPEILEGLTVEGVEPTTVLRVKRG